MKNKKLLAYWMYNQRVRVKKVDTIAPTAVLLIVGCCAIAAWIMGRSL
jgi:hypothetical protein